jgi:recombination protein RecA
MEDKSKAVHSAIKTLEKDGIVVGRIKDLYADVPKIEVISTGSLTLDYVLGVGGYPKGRIIEIFGKESGGKTLLSLLAIAQAQKSGNAALIDAEHAFDASWATKLGVDVGNLILSQPDSGEKALETVLKLTESKGLDLIVIDSVASLVPQKEIDGDIVDVHMALQARMMSQALRKLTGPAAKSQTVIIFINQIRKNVGVMYGPSDVTPGGLALRFYSSIRLSVKRLTGANDEIKRNGKIIGHAIEVKVVKNKVAKPVSDVGTFKVYYDSGVDHVDELLSLGFLTGQVIQKGSSITFGDRKWIGRDDLYDDLLNDADLRKGVSSMVNAHS